MVKITPNSVEKNYQLSIHLNDTYAYALKVWIFSDDKKLVYAPDDQSGFYRAYQLPKGKYIIRLEIDGLIEDNNITLESDLRFGVDKMELGNKLKAPELFSSALIGGGLNYSSSHDYYTKPAVEISKTKTFNKRLRNKTSGIFIFLRHPDAEYFEKNKKKKPTWESFSLTNENGDIIAEYPKGWRNDEFVSEYNIKPQSGYIALSGHLTPGLYFLNYSGKDARVIPISIYRNWYSHVFLTIAEEPLFGTLRIFLSANKTFNPNDRNHLYIDYCLNKLQNGDYSLDEELIRNIAYQKFDSPMLGLIGAYIYLISKETGDDGLFKIIVRNLQEKILKDSKNSPDIWALNLLSYAHSNETVALDRQTAIKGTPMLRIAYDAIKHAAVRFPFLISENSLNDHIAENQCFDSPFNTFRPIQGFIYPDLQPTASLHIPGVNKGSRPSKKRSLNGSDNSIKMMINGTSIEVSFNDDESDKLFRSAFPPSNKAGLKASLDRYSKKPIIDDFDYVPIKFFSGQAGRFQLFNAALNEKTGSPLSSYIATALLQHEDWKPSDFAEKLNLPLNTVLRIFKELHVDTTKIDAQKELKTINIDENFEVHYWADRLKVSPKDIVNAVKEVGNSSSEVTDFLKGLTH